MDFGININDTDEKNVPGLAFFIEQQKKTADEVIERIKGTGRKVDSWECDLSDTSTIPELFNKAEESLGSIDILVNNAADYSADTFVPIPELNEHDLSLWAEGPLKEGITAETHDKNFAVNSRAGILLMAEYTRRYIKNKKKWGRIINISADCASGCPGEVSYRASKYALESYSRSAAAELGPFGITVNVVSPGPIQSGYITVEEEKAMLNDIPMRRIGKPNDIANAVIFFASEQADWITGQLLLVHGGHRMSLGR